MGTVPLMLHKVRGSMAELSQDPGFLRGDGSDQANLSPISEGEGVYLFKAYSPVNRTGSPQRFG